MKRFPFISQEVAVTLFRLIVAFILIMHGVMRLYAGTVNDFGRFLDDQGFPGGIVIAWFLTLFEIAGGLAMALGYLVPWIAAVFMIEIFMGVLLVHAQHGWFVVGHQLNGVEFSVLLIFSLLLIAAFHPR